MMKKQEESAQFIYDDDGHLVAMYKMNGSLKLYIVTEAGLGDLDMIFSQKSA